MTRRKKILGLATLLAVGTSATLVVYVAALRLPAALLDSPPGETLTLRDLRGEALAEIANATARSQHARPLAQLGSDLPRVTVALEDRRFQSHGGIDWRSMAAAAWQNARHLRVISGLAPHRPEIEEGFDIRSIHAAIVVEVG